MHIPDNYLSPSTCAVLGAAMVPVWATAGKKVKEELPKAKMPMLGIGAAFSFLIMMFNIPLPGGSTGHAVGGTLLAILLGPYSACISLTVTLLIQALLFGDGGILAYGANCFNMAFVLPFLGYSIYRFIKDRIHSEKGEKLGIVLGSYLGINAAAFFAAVEFGIQPLLFRDSTGQPLYCPYPLSVSIPAMTIPHLIITGIVEAVFTLFIYIFIKKVSPGTIYQGEKQKTKAIYGFIMGFIFLTPLGLLATGTAWGEWNIHELKTILSGGNTSGFIPKGMANGFDFKSLLPDYSISGLPEITGYILSAVIGAAFCIILYKVISSLIKNKSSKEDL
ncbi:MAG: cobalt transporter CbiM [Clostridiales bacterium]|nr:cobalt transporter CbiM [Clostridiales bacterium]